jgi:hypothetical protein
VVAIDLEADDDAQEIFGNSQQFRHSSAYG